MVAKIPTDLNDTGVVFVEEDRVATAKAEKRKRQGNEELMGPTGSELTLIKSNKTASGFQGVRKNGAGWGARIRNGGCEMYLGTYDSKEMAARAYAVAHAEPAAKRITMCKDRSATAIAPKVGELKQSTNDTSMEALLPKDPSDDSSVGHGENYVNNVCVPIVGVRIVTCDDVHGAGLGISMAHVRSVCRILNIKDFKMAFQDADGDVKQLQAAKQIQRCKRHLTYADNTVNAMIIVIIAIINKFQGDRVTPETRQKWLGHNQEYNRKYKDATLLKQQSEVVMDFDDFLQMMKDM